MPDTAPIFGFNQHRRELVEHTVERVVEQTRDPLLALNDAAYHETRRLDKSQRLESRYAEAGRDSPT